MLASESVSHLGAQTVPQGDPGVIITTIAVEKTLWNSVGFTDGALWFATKEGLIKLDLQNEQFSSVPISERVKRVGYLGNSAVGGGSLWLHGKAHNIVGIHRVDLRSGKCVATVELKPRKGVHNLIYGEGSLWVLNEYDGNLLRIDPGANQVSATIELGKGFWQDLKIADGSIWAMGEENGIVKRVDAQSNKVVDEFSARKPQPGMGKNMLTMLTHLYEGYGAAEEVANKHGTYLFAVGEGALWIADVKDSGKYSLWRLDPKTHEPIAKIEINESGGAPVFWNGYGWVITRGHRITRINPKTNIVDAEISLPDWNGGGYWHPDPGAFILLAGEDSLWAISGQTPGKAHLVIRRIQPKPTEAR